ncbi:retinol dehydrogenase 12-like isoform X2 [Glandiceps talaboti]
MTVGVLVAIFIGFLGVLYLLRKYFRGGVCTSTARLDGKTIIVTGANTGIGKETARDLAKRGARVILACRDLQKAHKALCDIKTDTGNKNVIVRKLDLASLESIRKFAEETLKEEERLDILINNAGVYGHSYAKTCDGFEMHFGVNHLGHFLLTNILLDLLKKSAPSRIVVVGARLHEFGTIKFDDINSEKSYNRLGAYNDSKLANNLFTRELSKKLVGTGVTVNCLHPGVIQTELVRHLPFVQWLQFFFYPVVWLLFKTLVDGAQTTIHCAVAEQLETTSGLYFSDCAVCEPHAKAKDDDVAKQLWDLSAEMVGLKEN